MTWSMYTWTWRVGIAVGNNEWGGENRLFMLNSSNQEDSHLVVDYPRPRERNVGMAIMRGRMREHGERKVWREQRSVVGHSEEDRVGDVFHELQYLTGDEKKLDWEKKRGKERIADLEFGLYRGKEADDIKVWPLENAATVPWPVQIKPAICHSYQFDKEVLDLRGNFRRPRHKIVRFFLTLHPGAALMDIFDIFHTFRRIGKQKNYKSVTAVHS